MMTKQKVQDKHERKTFIEEITEGFNDRYEHKNSKKILFKVRNVVVEYKIENNVEMFVIPVFNSEPRVFPGLANMTFNRAKEFMQTIKESKNAWLEDLKQKQKNALEKANCNGKQISFITDWFRKNRQGIKNTWQPFIPSVIKRLKWNDMPEKVKSGLIQDLNNLLIRKKNFISFTQVKNNRNYSNWKNKDIALDLFDRCDNAAHFTYVVTFLIDFFEWNHPKVKIAGLNDHDEHFGNIGSLLEEAF